MLREETLDWNANFLEESPLTVWELANRQVEKVRSARLTRFETHGYGLTPEQFKQDLAESLMLTTLLGFDDVNEGVLDLLLNKKAMNGTEAANYLNILSNLHSFQSFPQNVTYDELETFSAVNDTLGIWNLGRLPTDNEVFSTDLAITLLDLSHGFGDRNLIPFDPELEFDKYLEVLRESNGVVRRIYDERWKLVKQHEFGQTIDAVLASEGDDESEFRSVLGGIDMSVDKAKTAIKFGVGLTATVFLSSTSYLDELADAIENLVSSYMGFDHPLLNTLIGRSLGHIARESAKKGLAAAFGRVMRKPWARAYLAVARPDLPSDLRMAVRDIWVLA